MCSPGRDASRVALIGAGPQASIQLKSLRLVRSLNHVRIYDPDLARSLDFATRMYHSLNLPVRPAETVEEAVADADIVVTATSAHEPSLPRHAARGHARHRAGGRRARPGRGLRRAPAAVLLLL
jgi:ornithine cyclodeaminase